LVAENGTSDKLPFTLQGAQRHPPYLSASSREPNLPDTYAKPIFFPLVLDSVA